MMRTGPTAIVATVAAVERLEIKRNQVRWECVVGLWRSEITLWCEDREVLLFDGGGGISSLWLGGRDCARVGMR